MVFQGYLLKPTLSWTSCLKLIAVACSISYIVSGFLITSKIPFWLKRLTSRIYIEILTEFFIVTLRGSSKTFNSIRNVRISESWLISCYPVSRTVRWWRTGGFSGKPYLDLRDLDVTSSVEVLQTPKFGNSNEMMFVGANIFKVCTWISKIIKCV